MKKSKGDKPQEKVQFAIDWEVRPGGMLVQKRVPGSDSAGGPIINIKVSHDSYYHHLALPSSSTFGDLKRILGRETNLEAKDQRLLFRGKEKSDDECLDMAGVKETSKIILLEDPASKERKLVNDRVEAYDAVARVRAEVDKLSHKVVALETSIRNGVKVADQEVEVLTELFMAELLKLDGVEAQGDAKVQRRIEVKRVQSFVDKLDSLKGIRNPGVSVTKNWESFDSGMASPISVGNSTKITKDWETFE